MLRSLAFILFLTWATVQGALSLWGFRHDAAARDFGYFVHSARMWRDSGVLYENVPRVNLNPPHASVVLFTPLTWASFDAAVMVWVMLQISTLLAAIILIARELHLTAARLESITPAVVASAMTTHNWIEGQVGGILLVGGVLAWRALRRGQERRTSWALAGLISLKPQFGIMLLATDRRMKLRVILIGCAGLVAGFLLMGQAVWMSWLAITQANGLQLPPWNVSLAPMLYRAGLTDSIYYVYVPLAVLVFGVTWRATAGTEDSDRTWVLWGIAMLLIAPVTWVYYAAAFLGPFISWGEHHRWPVAALVGVSLWLIPLQMLSWVGSSPPSWPLAIMGSPYTWGAVLVWMSVLTSHPEMNSGKSSSKNPTAPAKP